MVIQKEIDLKALQSVLGDAMQSAIDNCEEVKINLIVAHDIVAVIKEAHKSEIQDKLKPIPCCIGKYDKDKTKCVYCKQQKECIEEIERKNWECEEETNQKDCYAGKVKKRINKNEKN